MLKRLVPVLLSVVLVSLPAVAQANGDASVGLGGCGPVDVKFDVKFPKTKSAAQSQPEPGKALIFFIEQDINVHFVTHTSRIDVDGKPMGATYGDSWFYFSIDPGLHHFCATTQFGAASDEVSTSVLHFTAEAGDVYYFEMKNLSWPEGDAHDASLLSLDSDQGKFLIYSLPLVTSRQKK
jgi:hypothetical protein